MPQRLELGVSESGDVHKIEGIPDLAWKKFTAAAKIHFPDAGDDAWARFLSEVIVSGSGGADTVSYFMTDVPREYAEELANIFDQVRWSWDRFHAYLLRAAHEPGMLRLISLSDTGKEDHMGTFIATGLKKDTFTKLEEIMGNGVTFERVMGTIFVAMADGTLRFEPDAEFIKPTN